MLLISQRQFFNFESNGLTIRNENIWSITTIMTISERRLEVNGDDQPVNKANTSYQLIITKLKTCARCEIKAN